MGTLGQQLGECESLHGVLGTTSLLREPQGVSSHCNSLSANKAYLTFSKSRDIGPLCGSYCSVCHHDVLQVVTGSSGTPVQFLIMLV